MLELIVLRICLSNLSIEFVHAMSKVLVLFSLTFFYGNRTVSPQYVSFQEFCVKIIQDTLETLR